MRASARELDPVEMADPRPVHAVWELTLRCDQACIHCGSRAGRAREAELDSAEVVGLGRTLAAMGCREITLVGGEAYLRPDFLEIVSALAGAGPRVTLLTGGRGVTPAMARDLKGAGLNQLAVSIDGTATTHERLRRVPGGFALALGALDSGRVAGLVVSANTQVNRWTLPELPRVAALVQDHGVRVWQVQLTSPMGRAADAPDHLLQPFQVLELIEVLAGIQRDAIARAEHTGDRPFDVSIADDIGYYGPHETLLRTRAGGPPRHWVGCQAGRFSVGIEADGSVKPCLSMPTRAWIAGSVRESSLEQIWHQGASIADCRQEAESTLWGFCASCYYAETCRGGCPSTTHTFLGRRGNNPFCWYRADQLRRRGRRERLEHVAPAAGQPFDHGRFKIIEEQWPQ